MLSKNAAKTLDLGFYTGRRHDFHGVVRECKRGRRAPITPSEFEAKLALKSFTNGKTDRPLVGELYRLSLSLSLRLRLRLRLRLWLAGSVRGPTELARAVSALGACHRPASLGTCEVITVTLTFTLGSAGFVKVKVKLTVSPRAS